MFIAQSSVMPLAYSNNQNNLNINNSSFGASKTQSFCGYKRKQQIKKGIAACAIATTTVACAAKPVMAELSRFDTWTKAPVKQVSEQTKGISLSLQDLLDSVLKKTDSNTKKTVEKTSDEVVENVTINKTKAATPKPMPDASVEIASLKNATYTDKNIRLYSLYRTNEYNPQLKDYLLSSRMNYLNQNMQSDWAKLANQFCEKYKVNSKEEKLTILSQMLQESALKTDAGSHVGAYGLMQIMPNTADALNKIYLNGSDNVISFTLKKDYKKVSDNIELGVILMAENLRRYSGCKDPLKTSLAAYNAGSPSVEAYLNGKSIKCGRDVINPDKIKVEHGIPPYDETQVYVNIIEDTKDYIQSHLGEMNKDIKQQLNIVS